MALLEFRIFGQLLKGKAGNLVSDTIDYIDADFDFRTDDWKDVSKWAHFSKGKKVYSVNLVDDRITKDMHLNLSEGIWTVKIHGTDPDGKTRITTNAINFCVNFFGKMPNGEPLPEVPVSAAEQIDAKAQRALVNSEDALSKSTTAAEKAEGAVKAAETAEKNSKTALEKASAVEKAAANGEFDGATGPIGPQGPPGPKGENGTGVKNVSVEQSDEEGGTSFVTIELTDDSAYGYTVRNGSKGETGSTGLPGLVWQGEWNAETAYSAIKNGQVSRDVVFYNGSAYVVSANSPAPVTGIIPEGDTTGRWEILALKGEKGDKGDSGEGSSGATGTVTSVNGIEPDESGNVAVPVSTIEVETTEDGVAIIITNSDGTGKTVEVKNGRDGTKGENGADGFSPVVEITEIKGGHRISVTDVNSTNTFDVMDGEDGDDGESGLLIVPISVDLTAFETEGIIVETYADGSTLTHNFEFDSDGRPTKRTDSAGNVQTFTW